MITFLGLAAKGKVPIMPHIVPISDQWTRADAPAASVAVNHRAVNLEESVIWILPSASGSARFWQPRLPLPSVAWPQAEKGLWFSDRRL